MARNHRHLSFHYSHYTMDYSRFFHGLFAFYFQKRVRRESRCVDRNFNHVYLAIQLMERLLYSLEHCRCCYPTEIHFEVGTIR